MDRRGFLECSLALPLAGAAAVWPIDRSATAEEGPPSLREDPYIRRCREVALSILKPTDKQLQHGLELHRASLVFDVYGFAPRAALDSGRNMLRVARHVLNMNVR